MLTSQTPTPASNPAPATVSIDQSEFGQYLARRKRGMIAESGDPPPRDVGGVRMLQSKIQTIWRALRVGRSERKPVPGVITTHRDTSPLQINMLEELFGTSAALDGEASIIRHTPPDAEPIAAEQTELHVALLADAKHQAEAGNWPAAIATWERAAAAFPEDEPSAVAHAEACRAMDRFDEADRVLHAARDRGGLTAGIAVGLALNAQGRSDWEQALQRWNTGRVHFPEIAVIWAAEMATLQILGRFGEADVLADRAAQEFPDNIDVAAQRLNIAIAQKHWAQARTRLDHLRSSFGDHDYVRGNAALLEGRIAEGESGISLERVLEQATAADARKDWAASAPLWELLHQHQANDCATIRCFGQALRESGRYDEADRVLAQGIEQFPDNIELLAHHAEVAASRKDWMEAAQRWRMLMQEHSELAALWPMAADAFMEVGWFEDATRFLTQAITREPERIDLRVQHAKLAEKQDDWDLAVERWGVVAQLKPDDLNIKNSRGDAIWQRTINALEKGEPAPAAPRGVPQSGSDADSVEPDALRELALKFESLGDNCEFGIVQRRFGADPLGLFRFGAVGAEALIKLADESFEPLGDPAFITLGLTSGNEYLVTDTRGLYHMHSFVQKGSVDEAKFLIQQTRRLGFLKKKLIEDLTEASKIFIYKSSLERIEDSTLRDMSAALQKFGPGTLLGIRQSDEMHAAGSLEVLDDRILVGYVSSVYDGEGSPIDFDSWRVILRAADMHKVQVDESEPALMV